ILLCPPRSTLFPYTTLFRSYNYVYYRTGNMADAEDLTAKIFVRAMKHMPRYQDQGVPFSAWLYRIAHNLVANWHRDHSRRQIVRSEEHTSELQSRENLVCRL